MNGFTQFLENSTNVYRTKQYIVKQCVGIQYDLEENNVVFSHDTYYRRNRKRDREYERLFADRKNINGKRLPTTMYARTFVD